MLLLYQAYGLHSQVKHMYIKAAVLHTGNNCFTLPKEYRSIYDFKNGVISCVN